MVTSGVVGFVRSIKVCLADDGDRENVTVLDEGFNRSMVLSCFQLNDGFCGRGEN